MLDLIKDTKYYKTYIWVTQHKNGSRVVLDAFMTNNENSVEMNMTWLFWIGYAFVFASTQDSIAAFSIAITGMSVFPVVKLAGLFRQLNKYRKQSLATNDYNKYYL
jgi:hypothetical protein